jgi:hypothetical protein
MRHVFRSIVGIAAGLATVLSAGNSAAGDYSDCYISEEITYPRDGDVDVPLNPILVSGGGFDNYSSDFEALRDENGDLVPTEVAFVYDEGYCDFAVYRPVSNLLPETTYVMVTSGWGEMIFTTGTNEDHQKPVIDVEDDPLPDCETCFNYVSNEPLVMASSEFDTGIGVEGSLSSASETGILDGADTTTFYDRAGNMTVVEAFVPRRCVPLGNGNDCDCAAVGAGSGSGSGPFGALVRVLYRLLS